MTFIVLWSTDQVFCSMSLSLALCDVFLMITSETMGLWEEKPLKVPFSSHHIKGTCCPDDTTIGVDLDHQAEVVFIRFLYYRVTPPTSCTVLFGRKFLCTQLLWLPHLMSGESCSPSVRRQSLHQLCRILLYRRNVHASLFIHSFISIWIHRHVFYTVDYNSWLHYLFCSSNCPSSSHWEPFHLAPLSFWYSPIGLCLRTSFFWPPGCSGLILYILCPEEVIFPIILGSFHRRMALETKMGCWLCTLLFALGPPGRQSLKT